MCCCGDRSVTIFSTPSSPGPSHPSVTVARMYTRLVLQSTPGVWRGGSRVKATLGRRGGRGGASRKRQPVTANLGGAGPRLSLHLGWG